MIGILALNLCDLRADEKLKDKACRSVHLAYTAATGDVFYNEIDVVNSAPGTYFCVCGFNTGYYGIQQLANGKRLLIFSIWDPVKGDDPKKVPDDKRVKLHYQDEKVRIGRFGNEGTGGQSFYDYDWKDKTTYRFAVSSKVEGERTAFTSWFYHPEEKAWKKLVTFSRLNEGKSLGGYYSFVEDFRRNGESAKLNQRANFGNAWVHDLQGKWSPIEEARFTADSNPVLNIDAGMPTEGTFFLSTGGEIENTTVKLKDKMKLKIPAKTEPDFKLPVSE
ncbi:MAG: DUF3472 domain-containing protein [Pirellulales bacterium]